MIGFLNGIVSELDESQIAIDVGGIGYVCSVPNSVPSNLKLGQQIKLITHMVVREDDISLYGFLTSQDKAMFLRLLSVSGVGAKVALSILSGLSGTRLIEVLASGDILALSAIKGIGKKTAERIVLELKDKVLGEFGVCMSDITSNNGDFAAVSSVSSDAIAALVSLGYSKHEASLAVSKVSNASSMSVEDVILKALKG